jgi:hypothetical protein
MAQARSPDSCDEPLCSRCNGRARTCLTCRWQPSPPTQVDTLLPALTADPNDLPLARYAYDVNQQVGYKAGGKKRKGEEEKKGERRMRSARREAARRQRNLA